MHRWKGFSIVILSFSSWFFCSCRLMVSERTLLTSFRSLISSLSSFTRWLSTTLYWPWLTNYFLLSFSAFISSLCILLCWRSWSLDSCSCYLMLYFSSFQTFSFSVMCWILLLNFSLNWASRVDLICSISLFLAYSISTACLWLRMPDSCCLLIFFNRPELSSWRVFMRN